MTLRRREYLVEESLRWLGDGEKPDWFSKIENNPRVKAEKDKYRIKGMENALSLYSMEDPPSDKTVERILDKFVLIRTAKDDIYERVKKAWKAGHPSTKMGAEKYVAAWVHGLAASFGKEFGKNIVDSKVIMRVGKAIDDGKIKDAFDAWEWLTDFIVKRLSK